MSCEIQTNPTVIPALVFKVLKIFNTMVLKLEAKQAAASVVMAQEVKKKEKKMWFQSGTT